MKPSELANSLRSIASKIDKVVAAGKPVSASRVAADLNKIAVAISDDWIPANESTEKPFTTRSGYRLQYVFQPSTGKHAYLNLDNDLILSDEEAEAALK